MHAKRLLLSLLLGLGAALLVAVLLVTGPLPQAHAETLTVNTTLDNESNGCGTDDCTLREAIADANPGDTINFDLTYPATITLTSGQLTITKGLTIDSPGADQLAISGNDASRVFYISSGKVTLNDLKITQGTAPDSEPGGGIYIVNGNTAVTLTRVNVVGNNAYVGGGIHLESGSLVIEGGQILSNTAVNSGGGVHLESGEATLNEGEIRGNTAEYAGGVYVGSDLGTATFTQTGASIIGYNTALYSGGGLYVDNGIAVLASGQVISNTAEGTDSDRGGGGLYASGIASVAVSGGQILSNTARRGGGMYLDLFDLGDATLTSGEIRGNIAQDGGGMYIYEGNATLNGGQIVNNTADNGGSVYANAGSVTLSGGQITNNSVTSNSSALYNDSSMINTTTILTITGDIYQEGGVFSCDGNSLVLQGSLTLAGGTFTAPSTELRIAGDLTRSGGTFDANGGNVFFHGAGIQTLNANTITFYSVTVNSGVTLTTESVVTVNGGVALETGAATQETRSVSSTDLLAFALADLTITPATQGNLSSLRVTRVEISHPDAAGGIQTNRYWSIAAIGSGYTATLTLPHDGLSDPYACKYTGSGWEGARDSFDSTTVTRSDITSFSDWGVSDGLPTAVTLASFTATPQEGGILVAWETAIEIDNVGFNLYRTQAPEGAWVRLNDTLIPSQSPGSVFGTTYAWLDENVETGTTYYYKLEDIEVGGKHTFHGPVAAQPTEPAALVLRSFGIPGSPAIALLVLLGICSPAIVWRVRKRR